MSTHDARSRLASLERALDSYISELEQLESNAQALAKLDNILFDYRDIEDVVAFEFGPEWGKFLRTRLDEARGPARRTDGRESLASIFVLSETVCRVKRAIRRFLANTRLPASTSIGKVSAAGEQEPDAPAMNGESPAKAQEPGWKRLTIIKSNTGDDLARIDEKDHRLTGASDATFLDLLQKQQGGPILATTLDKECGDRCARIFARLPKPLQKIIDKPGRGTGKKGYRML